MTVSSGPSGRPPARTPSGTAIATAYGGSGLGLTELSLVLEEQGRTLAAVPVLATLVMGALPLDRFGTPGQRALLPQVAAGEVLLTAALEEEGGTDPLTPAARARAVAGGWRLSGGKTRVPYAPHMDDSVGPFMLARDGAVEN